MKITIEVPDNFHQLPVEEQMQLVEESFTNHKMESSPLKAQEPAFLKRGKLLRAVIDALPDYIFVKDRDGHYLETNVGLAKASGMTPQTMIGTSDADYHPPERVLEYREDDLAVMNSGKPLLGREEIQLDAQRKPRWVSTTKVPLYDDSGEITGIVGISRDITLQKRAQVKILELNKELKSQIRKRTQDLKAKEATLGTLIATQKKLVEAEKMASLGSLVAGVAHEINTPVGNAVTAASHLNTEVKTAIEMYDAEEMSHDDLENYLNRSREALKIILENLIRASKLVKSFKQVSVDQAHDEERCFNVKDYLDQILIGLSPEVKKTRQTLKVSCDEDIEFVSFPGIFAQVITNFVINSLHHAFDPDDEGYISIEIKRENDDLNVVFSDNGKGIPKENMNKIYDPFFTTARNEGGTGLGLNIVYNMVTQKLGGDIHCESTEGEGTSFILRLPSHH